MEIKNNRANFINSRVNSKQSNKAVSTIGKTVRGLIGGVLIAGGVNTCCDYFDRSSGTDSKNGVVVEYQNSSKQVRDSLMKPVYDMKSQLKPENDFINGIKFDIINSFKKAEVNDDFEEFIKKYQCDKSYKGISFYSDSKAGKYVAVQENTYYTNKANKIKQMRQTLMHEVGHHFDNYFGHDHNDKTAQQWDSILSVHEKRKDIYIFSTVSEKDKSIEQEFYAHNALSDKEEFKQALQKDIINLHKQKELPKDINYYVRKNGGELVSTELGDMQRGEVYANLFSYLSGQDDGEREKFLKSFSNSSKVVKKDMSKYLKILK